MDSLKFWTTLPTYFDLWGQGVPAPRSKEFQTILEQTGDPVSASLLQIVNLAVAHLGETEVYCQAGCGGGALLAGALQGHPEASAYLIDPQPTQAAVLTLMDFGLGEQVLVYCQELADVFVAEGPLPTLRKIGVYSFDGTQDYRTHLMGLLRVIPWLADQALIFVQCRGVTAALQATADFVSTHPACHRVLTLTDGMQTDWQLLVWDTTASRAQFQAGFGEPLRLAGAPPRFWQAPNSRHQVLHVGCGPAHAEGLHTYFQTPTWQEIRLDVDPAVTPDLVGNMTDLSVIPDGVIDAVWSSHNIEHLYDHEVPLALREFHRILQPNGFVLVRLPDMQKIAEYVAQGRWDDPLYISPVGPISAVDVVYGHRLPLSQGNDYMAHKTGFTAQSLGHRFLATGFSAVQVVRDNINLWAIAYKQGPLGSKPVPDELGITGEETLYFGQ